MRFMWVYITTASRKEALRIGRALVKARLAACINILGPIESLYWWKGKLETGREVALVAKTTSARLKELVAKVKSVHSYEVPCVVALPMAGGNEDFLGWIARETVKASSGGAARKRARSGTARRG